MKGLTASGDSTSLRMVSDAQLIERIVAGVPEALRASLRTALIENRLGQIGGLGADAAASLDEWMRRRGQTVVKTPEQQAALTREAEARDAEGRRRWANSREVLVALTAEPVAADVGRVSIYRTPDDGGMPVILLRAADATPADLDDGIRAAALSIRRDGVSVPLPSRTAIPPEIRARPASPDHVDLFQYLRAGRFDRPVERDVAGLGRVRGITIRAMLPDK